MKISIILKFNSIIISGVFFFFFFCFCLCRSSNKMYPILGTTLSKLHTNSLISYGKSGEVRIYNSTQSTFDPEQYECPFSYF